MEAPRIKSLTSLLTTLMLAASALPMTMTMAAAASTPMPARFEAHRVFLDIPLAQGGTLSCYTDSGGGAQIVTLDAARRLGLTLTPATDEDVLEELGKDAQITRMPPFEMHSGVPNVLTEVLAVRSIAQLPGSLETIEGFLGSPWLGGHIWTWDYAAHRLALEDPGWKAPRSMKPLAVGFRKSEDGKTYSCTLKLTDGGKKMEVRGYIGVSLLGRTEVWTRQS